VVWGGNSVFFLYVGFEGLVVGTSPIKADFKFRIFGLGQFSNETRNDCPIVNE
jgi:hypothetical protein